WTVVKDNATNSGGQDAAICLNQ
ncbi:hypothetical protein pipiens_008007, partial [Culex pipiens pipiens]